ncbi:MAG TPA: hypothetical protein VFG52_10550 [Xanthomonadales bacterium]|nr:hypothetical protein [Xanthomonadales bacterium]
MVLPVSRRLTTSSQARVDLPRCNTFAARSIVQSSCGSISQGQMHLADHLFLPDFIQLDLGKLNLQVTRQVIFTDFIEVLG